jgi:hypothetical protein
MPSDNDLLTKQELLLVADHLKRKAESFYENDRIPNEGEMSEEIKFSTVAQVQLNHLRSFAFTLHVIVQRKDT